MTSTFEIQFPKIVDFFFNPCLFLQTCPIPKTVREPKKNGANIFRRSVLTLQHSFFRVVYLFEPTINIGSKQESNSLTRSLGSAALSPINSVIGLHKSTRQL